MPSRGCKNLSVTRVGTTGVPAPAHASCLHRNPPATPARSTRTVARCWSRSADSSPRWRSPRWSRRAACCSPGTSRSPAGSSRTARRRSTPSSVACRASASTSTILVLGPVLVALTWRRCRAVAIAIAAATLARPLLEFTLKELVDRPRPDLGRLVNGVGPSFPSGHVMAAVALWGLLPIVVGLFTTSRRIWWASVGRLRDDHRAGRGQPGVPRCPLVLGRLRRPAARARSSCSGSRRSSPRSTGGTAAGSTVERSAGKDWRRRGVPTTADEVRARRAAPERHERSREVSVALQETMRPGVVTLADASATDPDVVGSKAAALAAAMQRRAPRAPRVRHHDAGPATTRTGSTARPASHWDELSEHGARRAGRAVVVAGRRTRVESSMAGRFASVVGVTGWDAFVAAVEAVVASAADSDRGARSRDADPDGRARAAAARAARRRRAVRRGPGHRADATGG